MLAEDEYILELAETSEFSDRKNFSIYFKLVEICKEINKDEALKKNKRNVSVIQDVDVIYIGSDLPKEYTGSKYTNSMQGTNEKARDMIQDLLCRYMVMMEK